MTTRSTAKTVAVNREKLIARLKERLNENDSKRAALWAQELKERVASCEQTVRDAQAELASVKRVKTPYDTTDYWARDFKRGDALAKNIALLELSDAETINVGPTSDLFDWL